MTKSKRLKPCSDRLTWTQRNFGFIHAFSHLKFIYPRLSKIWSEKYFLLLRSESANTLRFAGRSTRKQTLNWSPSTRCVGTRRGYLATHFLTCPQTNTFHVFSSTLFEVSDDESVVSEPIPCWHRHRREVQELGIQLEDWSLCDSKGLIVIFSSCIYNMPINLKSSLAKVTEFQLEKLFGKKSEAKSFIQTLIRGYLAKNGHVQTPN